MVEVAPGRCINKHDCRGKAHALLEVSYYNERKHRSGKYDVGGSRVFLISSGRRGCGRGGRRELPARLTYCHG